MFLGAVSHNAFIVVLSLVVQIPFALGIALMLNRRFRGRTILRLIFFAPYVIAEVITAIVWSLILQPNGLADNLHDDGRPGGRCTSPGWPTPTPSSPRCSSSSRGSTSGST